MGMRLLGGRQVRWAAVAQLGSLLGCLVLSTLVYRYFEVCDRETGGALAEFPAFGNADIDPGPDDGEDCYAPFITTAPTDSVIGYYRDQLSSHGWRVRTVTLGDMEMYYEANDVYLGEDRPDEPELHMLAGERRNVCYFVNVTPSQGAVGIQRVWIAVKHVPPGEMLYPPHHRC